MMVKFQSLLRQIENTEFGPEAQSLYQRLIALSGDRQTRLVVLVAAASMLGRKTSDEAMNRQIREFATVVSAVQTARDLQLPPKPTKSRIIREAATPLRTEGEN